MVVFDMIGLSQEFKQNLIENLKNPKFMFTDDSLLYCLTHQHLDSDLNDVLVKRICSELVTETSSSWFNLFIVHRIKVPPLWNRMCKVNPSLYEAYKAIQSSIQKLPLENGTVTELQAAFKTFADDMQLITTTYVLMEEEEGISSHLQS
jgi:hypothetical protein